MGINYEGKIRKGIGIVVGTFLMAVAVKMAYEPAKMVTGGISGVAIIIQNLSRRWITGEIPVWISNMILNLPIFALALFVKGRRYIYWTFFANLSFSLALYVIPSKIIFEDVLLVAIFGGVCTGIGLGIVFREETSTGGTDLLSSVLQHIFPKQSVSVYLFLIDSGIILWGVFLFGIRKAGYAIIAIFISTKIMNEILSGMNYAKMIYVVSSRYEEIGNAVMAEMDRGMTLLHGMGMYRKKRQPVLLSVVKRREITKFIKIVQKYDKNAFIIITDATEVMGEGFVENRQ